jgi:peptidyl-prolyl cis-trans isomerase C
MRRSWVLVLAILSVTLLSTVLAYGADDDILAKVGGEKITRSDFDARVDTLAPGVKAGMSDVAKRKQVLDSMIKERLLFVEGGNKGLTEKEDVKARLRNMRDDFITQEYVRIYIEKNAEVSDEEAQNYYNTHPEIKEREHFKVSQIVVQKEEEAKVILEKLKKGEPFKKLVKEYSIHADSKQKSGELDWFEKGSSKDKEIELAVSKLEKEGISDVIKINDKCYIFKLDDRKLTPKIPFEKVKGDIVKFLKYKKLTGLMEKEVEDLKKNIPVEIFYEKLIPDTK